MKNLILLFSLVFITINTVKAQREFYYSSEEPGVVIEPLLYLQDSNYFLNSRNADNFNDEIDYIGHHTSNVNVIYRQNNVYISWNVCDDSTRSLYIIKKTTDNIIHTVVGVEENIPCSPHVPLLYSLQDKNVILDKPHFYKLYKILEDGSMVHIVTIILPKQKNSSTASAN